MDDNIRADALKSEMTTWRHEFHAAPELGFGEHQTAKRVAELLRSFGLDVYEGIGGTGVVAILQRGNGIRSIGLRADMDALPITEGGDVPYASLCNGVMHACGHDGHMAMLLGAAKGLAEQGDFDGRVTFIFQPNEENGLGASAMLRDGLFERFNVDEIYGMHNIPGMPIGTFATRKGPITASESLFEITVLARGGHAALPHMGVDAIVVGAEIVGALQTIVSRKLNPSQNGVVSVTEFRTDGKRNVLPGHATLSGDARALSPGINQAIEDRMRRIVAGICMAHDVTASISYDTIFPPTINADGPVERVAEVATGLMGREAVDADCPPKLFSEDFAHLASQRPGCFVLVGNGIEGPNARPLHASDYDFCDDALPVGAAFWMALAEACLKKE